MKKIKYNLENFDIDFFEQEIELDFQEADEKYNEQMEEYLKLDYPVTLTKETQDDESYWVASHPNLPGCKAHGDNEISALENLKYSKESWIYSMVEAGLTIPLPEEDELIEGFSGKVLLRLPKSLHFRVNLEAKKDKVSLNQKLVNMIQEALDRGYTITENKKTEEKIDMLLFHIKELVKSQTANKIRVSKNPSELGGVNDFFYENTKHQQHKKIYGYAMENLYENYNVMEKDNRDINFDMLKDLYN